LNRVESQTRLAAFRDPEWQAQTFAAAVLMPPRLVAECSSITEIAKKFGVTVAHADVWVQKAGILLKRKG